LVLAAVMVASGAMAADVWRDGDSVANRRGDVLGGVRIAVYAAGTDSLVTLYTGVVDTTATKVNPTYTDTYGRFSFYVPAGLYDLAFTGSGITSYTIEDVVIGDVVNASISDSLLAHRTLIDAHTDSTAAHFTRLGVHADTLAVHKTSLNNKKTRLDAHADSLTAHRTNLNNHRTDIVTLEGDVADRQTIEYGELYLVADWGDPFIVDFDAAGEDSLITTGVLTPTWVLGDALGLAQGNSLRALAGFSTGKFLFTYHLTFSAADTSTFKVGLSKSGTEINGSANNIRVGVANELMSVSGSAVSACTSGSLVAIGVRAVSDTTDFRVHRGYISASRID